MLPAKMQNITCQTEKAKARSWALTSVSSSIIKTAEGRKKWEKLLIDQKIKYMSKVCSTIFDKWNVKFYNY